MLKFLRTTVDLAKRTIEAADIWHNMQNDQLDTLVDQSTSTSGWRRLLSTLASLAVLRRTDHAASTEIINRRVDTLTREVTAAVEDQLSTTPYRILSAANYGSMNDLLAEASRPSNLSANRAFAGIAAGIVMTRRDRHSNVNTTSNLAGRWTSAVIRNILLPAPCAIAELIQPSRPSNYFADSATTETNGRRDDKDNWVIIHQSRVTQNLSSPRESTEESVRHFADSAGYFVSSITDTLIHKSLQATDTAANWLRQKISAPCTPSN